MMPLEQLHLKHVQQTVCVLESVILRSFGPEGGQVLFTRDTGQAMLSRSGTRILRALQLENPVARMVVECVWKHSTATGDGSKTFILLLASLLRVIHATASKEPTVSSSYNSSEAAQTATARHLADKLLAFAMTELDDLINTQVVTYGYCVSWEDFAAKTQTSGHTNIVCIKKMLASFFHTRLSHVHCDFISDLTCELISHFEFKNDVPSFSLQFLNDNFPALHTNVSGFTVSSSRLIEGQVIHRDFATPCPPHKQQPIKAVVFTDYLQPKLLSADVLELGYGDRAVKERSILQFSALMERSLECVITNLQTLGVSVLLCAVKQSAAVLSLATQAGMGIVECVSEDELCVFAQLSGTTPVSDCRMIEKQHVATLAFCRPIQLGAHRYVHVDFHDSEERIKSCSLVICAPGEGQADQYACAFQDAIRMLLTTWDHRYETTNTASKRTQKSQQGSSLHTKSLTDSTACGSTNTLSHYKHEAGCMIPAGGTFEFLLSFALLQHGHNHSVGNDRKTDMIVSQLLANALMSIPRQIYSHSRRKFLETHARVMSIVSTVSNPLFPTPEQEHNRSSIQTEGPLEEGKPSLHCLRNSNMTSKDFISDLGLESVSCKHQLLLAVLQCLTSLLRVDTILHIHTALHTQSRIHGNSAWEDTEDED